MEIRMTKPEIIKYSIIGAVGILLIILIVTLFRATNKTDDSLYKELIAAKDETIKAKDELIAEKLNQNIELDKTISELKARDSVLTERYLQNQIIYKKLDAQLKNIPARISAIAGNDDDIRRAFSEP